jgi:hypothetical protein
MLTIPQTDVCQPVPPNRITSHPIKLTNASCFVQQCPRCTLITPLENALKTVPEATLTHTLMKTQGFASGNALTISTWKTPPAHANSSAKLVLQIPSRNSALQSVLPSPTVMWQQEESRHVNPNAQAKLQ